MCIQQSHIMLATAICAMFLDGSTSAEPRIDIHSLPQEGGIVERLPARRVLSFGKNHFLESIVSLPNGDFLITEAIAHVIWRVTLDGERELFHQSENKPVGLSVDIDGRIVASGRTKDDTSAVFVFRDTGELERSILIEEAVFLNGSTFLEPGQVLVADSGTGKIYRVNIKSGTVSIWAANQQLTQHPDRNPLLPGVNGLKLFDGALYATNSSRMTVVRLPVLAPGRRAGEPQVIAENIVLDDFAFAADGTIYGTTHIFDSVVRLELDGSVTTIATDLDGVQGSTAAAFGASPEVSDTLFVVGDGGIYLEPENHVAASLVAIDVKEVGLSLAASFSDIPYPGRVEAEQMAVVRCTTAPNAEAARQQAAGEYTRFLELNIDRIAFAGQIYGDGRDSAPTQRIYFFPGADPVRALNTMQSSPYFTKGVYSSCDAAPFDFMLGSLTGSVAWPDEVSRNR